MASRLTEETMRQRWSCRRPEEQGGPGPGGLGKPRAWQAKAAAVAGPGPRLYQFREPTSRLPVKRTADFLTSCSPLSLQEENYTPTVASTIPSHLFPITLPLSILT